MRRAQISPAHVRLALGARLPRLRARATVGRAGRPARRAGPPRPMPEEPPRRVRRWTLVPPNPAVHLPSARGRRGRGTAQSRRERTRVRRRVRPAVVGRSSPTPRSHTCGAGPGQQKSRSTGVGGQLPASGGTARSVTGACPTRSRADRRIGRVEAFTGSARLVAEVRERPAPVECDGIPLPDVLTADAPGAFWQGSRSSPQTTGCSIAASVPTCCCPSNDLLAGPRA